MYSMNQYLIKRGVINKVGVYWFTGDTHFNHPNIIDYCNRPFKCVEHMDMEIIRKWNERVKENDTVIHLGDFGFLRGEKDMEYYFSQLNGSKIIIKGNHDGNNRVKTIITSLVINYGGIDWWCEHNSPFQFKYNICGHVHTLWKVHRRSDNSVIVNVGVDVWNFYPVSIQEVIKVIGDAPLGYSGGDENEKKGGEKL